MWSLLSPLFNTFKRHEFIIDTFVFRIHTGITVGALLMCSLLLTALDILGDNIKCTQADEIYKEFMGPYCLTAATYTVRNRTHGVNQAKPGLSNDKLKGDDDVGNRLYYPWYQWVWIMLLIQCAMFYFPKHIWKSCEGGLVRNIVGGLKDRLIPEDERIERERALAHYLVSHLNRHNKYAFSYWFCELLCFINVIAQMLITNIFLGGFFLSYVPMLLMEGGGDYRDMVFPKFTKCELIKVGLIGIPHKRDILCVLPFNLFNEKIYIFLWFWLIILAISTAVVPILRLLFIIEPSIRSKMLQIRVSGLGSDVIDKLCRKISVGDWWLLYMIEKNIDPVYFSEVITFYSEKIGIHCVEREMLLKK